jgi:hypothetical protein
LRLPRQKALMPSRLASPPCTFAYATATCDEYLYVSSGRGNFWTEDPATEGAQHCAPMPKLFEPSVVFLSVDTPRRDPAP